MRKGLRARRGVVQAHAKGFESEAWCGAGARLRCLMLRDLCEQLDVIGLLAGGGEAVGGEPSAKAGYTAYQTTSVRALEGGKQGGPKFIIVSSEKF